jgi:glycosyltransferase involved in cell wall biosynthesis
LPGQASRSDTSDISDISGICHSSERAALRARWGAAPQDWVILSAGRLVREKGHVDLIAAAACLRDRYPNTRLVIAGEGAERPALGAAVSAAGLEGAVRLAGFENDAAAAYRAADVYCQPSYREGLPNSVLEAMASGLPTVATAVDGTPEAIVDGISGLLVPPGAPLALAAALARLTGDATLRQQMGGNARARVEARFSLDASVTRWDELLRAR